jgi:GTP-binding protein
VLLILVSFDPTPGRSPSHDLATLRRELERFDPQLAARPSLVAVSKLDLEELKEILPEFEAELAREGLPLLTFSAATREGLEELLNRVEALLDQHPLPHKPRGKPLPTHADRPHAPKAAADPEE